jgi:protein-L-isoaspartate(D-aspartate) O-methyltransferase
LQTASFISHSGDAIAILMAHKVGAGETAMLRDIEDEVAYTHHEIGKDALDARVMAAIAKVPREQFIPPSGRLYAFVNGPVPIGHGQTISQPYIVALMTDLVAPRADSVILEVGTGSGYQAAVLAEIVRQVYSVEIIPALAAAAGEVLARLGYANVLVRNADGYQGWAEHAPFDGILVTAAAPHIPPPLVEQLKPGGRLVIPIGVPGRVQQLKVIEKLADGSVQSRDVLRVAFVPLTGPYGAAPA